MADKSYSPNGKDNILMSNIMLWNGHEWYELHIGGIVKFDDLIKRDDFWEYLEANINKEIKLEMYAYCLYGETGVTRDATEDEMKSIIDDDFPNNPIYRNYLSGEDNESSSSGYILNPMQHCSLKDKLQVLYHCDDAEYVVGILYEDFLRESENENQLQGIQTMQ